ncbi:hypothetical protein AAE02nite_50760 [Adhaeribacter aerolatus]|uniref:Uncharacterized protein n=1 Tax=Adhaeribacter aerolatus TaxID=670289 RepID=A0A512B622_9BACT|nr:hypothetical protein [Adhaeribacter aerolatus]GEO07412.1 hypothetical protein AAE02nite_50760 [Adhaeribacter aerolatus]
MKQINWLLLLFFVFLSLASGCVKKEDDLIGPTCQNCTVIKGRLTSGDGTIPIANAKITTNWVNTIYLQGGTVRKKAVSTTDSKGYYELKFQIRDDEKGEGYFDTEILPPSVAYLSCSSSGHSFAFFELKKDTTITVNYFIPKRAFVEVRLTNQSQIKASDYFASSFDSKMGIDGKQSCGPVITWSSGLPSNPVLEVAAGQPVIITTHKTKNGVKTTTYDTLNLSDGQKAFYNAEF